MHLFPAVPPSPALWPLRKQLDGVSGGLLGDKHFPWINAVYGAHAKQGEMEMQCVLYSTRGSRGKGTRETKHLGDPGPCARKS